MALPLLSTAQAFTQQQLRNQELGHLDAQTQALLTDVLLGQQKAQAEQQRHQAEDIYQGFMRQQLAARNAQMNNPNTGSINASIAQADERNPQQAELRDLQDQMQEATKNFNLAEQILPVGHPTTKMWQDAREKLDIRMRGVQRDVEARRQKDNEGIVALGSDVNSAESLNEFVKGVGATLGPAEAAKLYQGLIKADDGSGNLVWNDAQKARLAPYLAARTSAAQAYQLKKEKLGEAKQALAEQAEKRKQDFTEAYIAHSQASTQHLMNLVARGGAGGVGGGASVPLKNVEYIYPKKEDGTIDESAGPVGVRGLSKTGKMIVLDTSGNETTLQDLGGGTEKERKALNLNVQNATRNRLVQGAAKNAMNRLDEIEKNYPKDTTSVLISVHPEGFVQSMAASIVRGRQTKRQQQVDSAWRSFIDEAIPVFTGGLRGSDAFRRFLITQAPNWGAKNNEQIIDLFRKNIQGMDRAFANQAMTAFASDPKYWGTRPDGKPVTREDVDAAMQYVQQSGGAAAGGGILDQADRILKGK